MIIKQTVIDHITITRGGAMRVSLGLLVIENGQELSKQHHQMTLQAVANVADVVADVNLHLAEMGHDAVPASQIAHIEAIATVAGKQKF